MSGLIGSYSLTTVPYSFLCVCVLDLKFFGLHLIINDLSHISQYHR